MRILIIDRSAEGHAVCAKRIESFSRSDIEMLDLQVKLVLDRDYEANIREADVVILCSGLGDGISALARSILGLMPWLHVIMYVTDEAYSGGAFRLAHAVGVRKVLPDSSSPLDLLQELVAVYNEFRREGRAREGRVICVTHAKGGTGATSICAALAEVCSVYRRRTMLWDLDVETRDLCRSLTVGGAEAKVVSSWVNGSRDISRESLSDALIPVSQDVSVLMPPDGMAEAMDLVCHTDAMLIAQRILDLSRVMHDVILIDLAGRIGPATGALMRVADEVLIVIDDTVLGLTALDLFLSYVKMLVIGGGERVSFVVNGYSGSLLAVPQIEAELEPVHRLGERPWRLPPVPVDPKASLWPGSGRTLYSMGQKATRSALEEIALQLNIIMPSQVGPEGEKGAAGRRRSNSWWERFLMKPESGGNVGALSGHRAEEDEHNLVS
ncbi:MAG: AAA family ATPase [Deltaproteobacteria bacterium]|nr:AAA family ATPase [Deltaproteobacteria bacterium]